MITQTGTRVIALTPELALEFATMPTWRGERPLSAHRVEYLRRELECGNFHAPKWAVAMLRGRTVRMNGQHSSHMLAQAQHFPKGMNVVIDDFVVETDSDLGELFIRFDTPVSVRPPREQFSALLHGGQLLQDGDGRTAAGLERLASAIVFATSEFDCRQIAPATRASALHGNVGFIDFAWPFVSAKLLRRPAVLAAMYLSWLSAGDGAAPFWSQVAEESHPSGSHPSRVLARTLRERVATGPMSLDEGRELCSKCIHAWNNWRKGSEVSRLICRVPDQLPAAV